LLAACGPAATAVTTQAPPAEATAPAGAGEAATIRIAGLPILDTLPMYVAQQEGLFDKHGVKVELIPASSAPNRDQLITAGQADGMINEMISTMLYN
jgi:NitT/TauT family transport system substrate-binding protein